MARRAKRISKTNGTLDTPTEEIPYVMTRSSGRRTLAICVDEKAQVNIYSPFYTTEKDLQQFISEKKDWIVEKFLQARRHRDLIARKSFGHGQEFLFLGEKYPLDVQVQGGLRPKIAFDGQRWTVAVPSGLDPEEQQGLVKKKMTQWYRQQAQEVLGGRLFHYGRIVGVQPKKIVVRTQKHLWGNCEYSTRKIHLNWQIILAPLDVVDYVVVHELCHLLVPNHSRRFWKKVARAMPDYKARQAWLKANFFDMMLP